MIVQSTPIVSSFVPRLRPERLVVEPAPNLARAVVIAAGLPDAANAELACALEGHPIDLRVCSEYGAARDLIDTVEPIAVLLDPTNRLGRELCLDTTLARGRVAILGVVCDPTSAEIVRALALGVDDVVVRSDIGCLACKVDMMRPQPSPHPVPEAPAVLVAEPDRRRRAQIADQLRRSGVRVHFAIDHTEVRPIPGLRLVIAGPWIPSIGSPACLRRLRRHEEAAAVPWVFVGSGNEIRTLDGVLGREPGISFHDAGRDASVPLADTVKRFVQPPMIAVRRSARVPIATPVRFEMPGRSGGAWGCSVDLSLGGVFVRTLSAPPIGSRLRVAFDVLQRPLALEGTVVWRAGFGTSVPQGPGFGLEFDEPDDSPHIHALGAAYAELVEAVATSRMVGASNLDRAH